MIRKIKKCHTWSKEENKMKKKTEDDRKGKTLKDWPSSHHQKNWIIMQIKWPERIRDGRPGGTEYVMKI